MQLLGKEFIDKLCKYLESKWFWSFNNAETYKFFGRSENKGYSFNKIVEKIISNWAEDFMLDWNIIQNVNARNEKYLINKYEDSKNIPVLRKSILQFYFNNNVLYCPYCWLNQFQIILDDKLSSFDLDHFLPKSRFSQFALSLYNLFPVCKYCNQTLKWINNPLEDWKTAFHPIWWWLTSSKNWDTYTFTKINKKTFDEVIDCKGNRNGLKWEVFKMKVELDTRYKYHIDFFELQALYLQSPYIKNDLKHIKNTYDQVRSSYATVLDPDNQKCIFKNIMKWWYPNSENEILQYSGWKLKKDIINEIADNHFR
jgi:hypothetical protein